MHRLRHGLGAAHGTGHSRDDNGVITLVLPDEAPRGSLIAKGPLRYPLPLTAMKAAGAIDLAGGGWLRVAAPGSLSPCQHPIARFMAATNERTGVHLRQLLVWRPESYERNNLQDGWR